MLSTGSLPRRDEETGRRLQADWTRGTGEDLSNASLGIRYELPYSARVAWTLMIILERLDGISVTRTRMYIASRSYCMQHRMWRVVARSGKEKRRRNVDLGPFCAAISAADASDESMLIQLALRRILMPDTV